MSWDDNRLSRYLTLRDLHTLMTVAQCGSMGKAAAQLAVSQPSISKTIANMEHSLGVRLLDRSPRGVEATIYARALLERGAGAFDELREATRHIDFLAHPTSGELRIGSTIAIATGFVSAVVERLSRKYPNIDFHIAAGEASAVYRALEGRQHDLAILPMLTASVGDHLQADILYDEPLVVVASDRSPWARRRKITLKELMGEVWALPPPESLYGAVVAEAFRAHGLPVPRATVLSSITPLRNSLLASGRFISIVQGSVVRYRSNDMALRVLPIDLPTTRRPVGLITLKNRTLSPITKLFVDVAHELASDKPS